MRNNLLSKNQSASRKSFPSLTPYLLQAKLGSWTHVSLLYTLVCMCVHVTVISCVCVCLRMDLAFVLSSVG